MSQIISQSSKTFTRRRPADVQGWSSGQLLGFSGLSGQTDYEKGLVGRLRGPGLLELCLPYLAEVTFVGPVGPIEWGGDYLVAQNPADPLAAVFVDAHHLLIRGRCDVSESAGLVVRRQGDMTLIAVEEFLETSAISSNLDGLIESRRSWIERLDLPETNDPLCAEALRKAILMVRTQVMSPEGQIGRRWSTPDRWPHRQMWLWDSVFHAIGWRHFDLPLACEMIEAVFDAQREDGFIPHMISPDQVSDITQPPVLAFGVMQMVVAGADIEWARPLYPRLVRYLRWNQKNRDTDGNGLLEWYIEAFEDCRSGESGMDNSPRFDDAQQLDAVDFNSFMAQEYRVLAILAERLGYGDDVATHRASWQQYCDLINQILWNEQTGFYHDHDPATGRQTPLLASSGFLPMFCGAATSAQAERMVAHLSNPETFGTDLPVPSVSRCSRSSGEKDMWRGPVWVNMNWLIVSALESYGYVAEAKQLQARTCREIIDQYQRYGTIFEFYDDQALIDPPKLERKGRNAPEISPYHQPIHDFGWSASLFVDWVYQAAKLNRD